jgi:hypothetical protein
MSHKESSLKKDKRCFDNIFCGNKQNKKTTTYKYNDKLLNENINEIDRGGERKCKYIIN